MPGPSAGRALVSETGVNGVTRAAIAAFCCAVLAAGCGSEAHEHSQATSTTDAADTTPAKTDASAGPATTTHKARGSGTTVKVVSSQYGPVLADGRGQAFYLFASEKSGRSQCDGGCAQRWPPVLAGGAPRAGPGGHGRLLGTTRRTDGKVQLTYAGHPMYYYDGDAPGRILCQGVNEFGGLWLVVRPDGKPVI
jgi:predicted lipoprotein with Yx(FWY)xxD motif